MDLLTYLRRFEPEELVHIGGDTYATRTHDSLKISNGKWCWWSRNIGGTNALDYTNCAFHNKLVQAGMTQSMSRVAHCIDNGPMEGFWGILKRERYYGRRFTSKRELVQMIQQYIRYYNTRRVQRNLGVLTPMEKHELALAA